MQRAQTQVEPDTVVDTERLLANRKDRTQRLSQPPYQVQNFADGVANSQIVTGRETALIKIQHHRTVTPAMQPNDLDRSGSLANFQSADPIYRINSQQQAKNGTNISNFRNTNVSQNAGSIQNSYPSVNQEEQGCQMVSNSHTNLAAYSTIQHETAAESSRPELESVQDLAANMERFKNRHHFDSV